MLCSAILLRESFRDPLFVVLELIAGVSNILVIQVLCVLVKATSFIGSVCFRTLCLQGVERREAFDFIEGPGRGHGGAYDL